DFAPDGDDMGVDGWDCISGPYVLHGDESARVAVEHSIHQRPLISVVRDNLARVLKDQRSICSVSLYRATSSSEAFAEVLINNESDNEGGELLKDYPLIGELGPTGFISARQFLLCVRPQS